MNAERLATRSPAIALVATGAVSVQFGAALATHLFGRVGPVGAVTLRLAIAAAVLAAGGWRGVRRSMRSAGAPDLCVAAAFGLALAAMNLSFYESIRRIPLGVAVTVEFAGPLALALAGSRQLSDGLWAMLAASGVALLASGAGGRLDPAGLALAGLAGVGWIAYILLSRETGRRFDALSGLTLAMVSAAVVTVPLGALSAGRTLFDPSVLAIGAAVAMLSSVVPYSLELLALRRVTPRAFGVMLSLDPAVAACAGLVVLGQHPAGREWLALSMVVAANLGNSLVGRPGAVATTP